MIRIEARPKKKNHHFYTLDHNHKHTKLFVQGFYIIIVCRDGQMTLARLLRNLISDSTEVMEDGVF